MKRNSREPIGKPITIPIEGIRYLNHMPADYVAEISADGIRFRRKQTPTWFAVVPWPVILEKSVAIQSHANALAAVSKRRPRSRTA
ncbi:MAG: hypothetical protein WEA80_01985 [Gemmatimonadaceae bacterium]